MSSILKHVNTIKEFWLEPDSRRVEPERLLVTDPKRRVIEEMPYSPDAGAEVRASASRRLGVIIDFGIEVGGYPHLMFGAGKCRRLGIQAVESIEHFRNPVLAETSSISDPAFYYKKARGRPSGQIDLPHCGGFRYMWIYPEYPGRITIRDIWIDYTPYLTEDIASCGYFLSSDETLNRAWYSGLHTLEMCTVDPALGGISGDRRIGEGDWVLVDGAKRDRLIWIGDIAPMAVASYCSNDNHEAVRASLLSLSAYQEKNGYIPAWATSVKVV
jgi:hypothetical protein